MPETEEGAISLGERVVRPLQTAAAMTLGTGRIALCLVGALWGSTACFMLNGDGRERPEGEPASPAAGASTTSNPAPGGSAGGPQPPLTEYGSGEYAVLLSSNAELATFCWFIEETIRTSSSGEQTTYDYTCIDDATECDLYEPEGYEETTDEAHVVVRYVTVSGGPLSGSCDLVDAYLQEDSAAQCLYHRQCEEGLCVDWQCECPDGGNCSSPAGGLAPTTEDPDPPAASGGTAGMPTEPEAPAGSGGTGGGTAGMPTEPEAPAGSGGTGGGGGTAAVPTESELPASGSGGSGPDAPETDGGTPAETDPEGPAPGIPAP